MKMWILLLILGVIATCVYAITIREDVVFRGDKTNYSMGQEYNTTTINLSDNTLEFNDTTWTITPSEGHLSVDLNFYNTTYQNITETPVENKTVSHTFTSMVASTEIGVLQNGSGVGQNRSSSGGVYVFATDYFDEPSEWIFDSNQAPFYECTGPAVYAHTLSYPYTSGLVYLNNSVADTEFNCTFNNLAGECNYGASNTSSWKFPVSNESQVDCLLKGWGSSTTGNLTVAIAENDAYNISNLGLGYNWSVLTHVRRYYEWGYEASA